MRLEVGRVGQLHHAIVGHDRRSGWSTCGTGLGDVCFRLAGHRELAEPPDAANFSHRLGAFRELRRWRMEIKKPGWRGTNRVGDSSGDLIDLHLTHDKLVTGSCFV